MQFEWDEAKRRANLAKHGIDFRRAKLVFDGRVVTLRASSGYGEPRWLMTAMLDGRLVSVVWTKRGDAIRLISARSVRDDERESYRQVHVRGNR